MKKSIVLIVISIEGFKNLKHASIIFDEFDIKDEKIFKEEESIEMKHSWLN